MVSSWQWVGGIRWGLAGALVLCALQCACEHPPPAASPWQSGAIQRPPPALALRHGALTGQVIDDLHAGLAVLEGNGGAAALLLASATTLDDSALRDAAGARRLAIHAIYHTVHSRGLGSGFKQVRQLVDRMYGVAAKAPETRFALAYLRWILLSDGRGGLQLADMTPDVAQDLLAQLEILTRDHPDFDGPGDFDRDRLVAERDAVRALLANPPEQRPDPGRPVAAGVTATTAP